MIMQPYVTWSSVAFNDGRPMALRSGFSNASKGSTNCAGALVARKGIKPPAPSAPAKGGGKRDIGASLRSVLSSAAQSHDALSGSQSDSSKLSPRLHNWLLLDC